MHFGDSSDVILLHVQPGATAALKYDRDIVLPEARNDAERGCYRKLQAPESRGVNDASILEMKKTLIAPSNSSGGKLFPKNLLSRLVPR